MRNWKIKEVGIDFDSVRNEYGLIYADCDIVGEIDGEETHDSRSFSFDPYLNEVEIKRIIDGDAFSEADYAEAEPLLRENVLTNKESLVEAARSLEEAGALRAPYETYRESEVFGTVANLSLREMLALHKRRDHTDILMLEWISAIDDCDRWDISDVSDDEMEGLFELIMTLECMYGDYLAQAQHPHDRADFAYAVAEFLDQGRTLDDIGDAPWPLYNYLAAWGGE